MKKDLKIFTGSSNPELAKKICAHAGIKLGKCETVKFSNENLKVRILESVRGKDVYVVQSSCPPVNENIMELLIMIDAIKHAKADSITAVLPYYPYARSDKKDEPRISITARLVADLLETSGADRVMTMNLHSPQIAGFFRIPVDHLLAGKLICKYYKEKAGIENCVVVAPDAGSAKRAGIYAISLGLPLAILDKRRNDDSENAKIHHVIGDVKGKRALIFDDEIATGGSILEVVKAHRVARRKGNRGVLRARGAVRQGSGTSRQFQSFAARGYRHRNHPAGEENSQDGDFVRCAAFCKSDCIQQPRELYKRAVRENLRRVIG